MSGAGPSILSLTAAAIYVVVTIACLIAAGVAKNRRQPLRHGRIWVAIAVAFVALAAVRVTGLEDLLRESLREALRADAAYADRRAVQRPLAAIALAGVSLGAMILLWRQSRSVRGRRNVALLVATGATMVMGLLIALRIISLHQVDSLLYGPLKLNWAIDLGASALVLGSAALYVRLVRQRP